MICVHRAGDIGEGDIIVAWLAERGIAAMVKNRYAAGTLPVPQVAAPRGIEVCVIDPAQAEAAKAMLQEHDAASKPDQDAPPIEAACEDCGQTSVFPASQARTVQVCPRCRCYVDVPSASDLRCS